MYAGLSYCAFDRKMLDCTYQWLNDVEVLTLIGAQPVERNAQLAWFDTLNQRSDFIIHGIYYDNVPIGVFGLKNIANETAEYWGYIGKKEYWGKGIGKWIIESALSICHGLNIKRIYLKVLSNNTRAINLYTKYDFIEVSRDVEFIHMVKFI